MSRHYFQLLFIRNNVFRNYMCTKRKLSTKQEAVQIADSGILYKIRPATAIEIPKILDTRIEIGSSDCKSSLETWFKLDPNAIHLAENEEGEIIGTLGAFIYPENIINCGLFYINPEYRSSYGIAEKLLQIAILDRASNRIIAAHVQLWLKKFYSNFFYPTTVESFTCLRNIFKERINSDVLKIDLPEGVTIEPFKESHIEYVCKYDTKIVGYERKELLDLNCKEENSKTFVALKNGQCVGFGSVKLSCLQLSRVGPLYADNDRIAESLLKVLMESFPCDKGLAMMTINNNSFSNKLVKILGFEKPHELLFQYRGKVAEAKTQNIYALFDINGVPF